MLCRGLAVAFATRTCVVIGDSVSGATTCEISGATTCAYTKYAKAAEKGLAADSTCADQGYPVETGVLTKSCPVIGDIVVSTWSKSLSSKDTAISAKGTNRKKGSAKKDRKKSDATTCGESNLNCAYIKYARAAEKCLATDGTKDRKKGNDRKKGSAKTDRNAGNSWGSGTTYDLGKDSAEKRATDSKSIADKEAFKTDTEDNFVEFGEEHKSTVKELTATEESDKELIEAETEEKPMTDSAEERATDSKLLADKEALKADTEDNFVELGEEHKSVHLDTPGLADMELHEKAAAVAGTSAKGTNRKKGSAKKDHKKSLINKHSIVNDTSLLQAKVSTTHAAVDKKLHFLLIGNPGVGKSTIHNSYAGKVIFRSGVSWGSGLTYDLDEADVGERVHLDTPGLADKELRKKAAASIEEAIKCGAPMKIGFVLTLNAGRVVAQDVATLRVVHKAAPSIGTKYFIVINKISCDLVDKVYENIGKITASVFSDGIPPTPYIHVNCNDENLADKDNAVAPLPKAMAQFFDSVPVLQIKPSEVHHVDASTFEDQTEQYEALKHKLDTDKKAMEEELERMRRELETTQQAQQGDSVGDIIAGIVGVAMPLLRGLFR